MALFFYLETFTCFFALTIEPFAGQAPNISYKA